MARVTINDDNGNVTKELDFKDDMLSNQDLIERRETLPLKFDDEKIIESMLDFLNYKKDNTLVRTRVVYQKDGVKFELDEYEEPRKTCVVAVEGVKEEVDKEYISVKGKVTK